MKFNFLENKDVLHQEVEIKLHSIFIAKIKPGLLIIHYLFAVLFS